MINGILFDMDGVLIDSEQYINKAAVEFFSRKHVKVRSEDFIPYVGAGENNYLGKVAEKYGYPIDLESAKIETYTIYGELIEGKEQALPGVIRFIKNAHKADIAMGIATSADRMKMEINLKVMGLDPAWFKVLLNGRDVERKKPYPDMYVEAAKKMGVPIEQCVVFEDAINGVQAAMAAKAFCCGLTTSFSSGQLLGNGADVIISTLDDFFDFSTKEQFNRELTRLKAKQSAIVAREHAYTPYSKFKVGAAVVSKATNAIYSGCNVENSSYGATICAERGAMMKGLSVEGDFTVDMIVVVSDDSPPAPPCALCLQVLAEFTPSDADVYLHDMNDTAVHYRFNELLPHPFIFPDQRGRRP